MKAIAVIHDDIWQTVMADDMLTYDKPGQVTTLWRDAVWDTGTEPELDEEGVPTGEQIAYRRFLYNDEPYEVQKTATGGGYSEIGMIGDWHVVMLASKPSKLQAINQLSANKVLALATITTTDGEVSGWDSVLDEGDRAKISTWMGNHGHDEIPEGATARQATRRVWRVINSELDENSVDVAD